MPNTNALHCYCDLQNASVLLQQTQKACPHTRDVHTCTYTYVHVHVYTCMWVCWGRGEGCVQFAEVCEAGTICYAKGKILVM